MHSQTISRINDHSLQWDDRRPVVSAMYELAHLHFDVFNAAEASLKKRRRNELLKGLVTLGHAFEYLEAQKNALPTHLATE